MQIITGKRCLVRYFREVSTKSLFKIYFQGKDLNYNPLHSKISIWYSTSKLCKFLLDSGKFQQNSFTTLIFRERTLIKILYTLKVLSGTQHQNCDFLVDSMNFCYKNILVRNCLLKS